MSLYFNVYLDTPSREFLEFLYGVANEKNFEISRTKLLMAIVEHMFYIRSMKEVDSTVQTTIPNWCVGKVKPIKLYKHENLLKQLEALKRFGYGKNNSEIIRRLLYREKFIYSDVIDNGN